jgi:hypothetical protein
MQLHDSPEEHPTEQQMHVGHTGHAATNGVSTTVVSIGAQEAGTEGDMQAYSDALLYAQQLQGQQQPKPKHQVLNVQSRQSRPVALDSLLYQMHQAHNQLQNSLLIGAGQKQQRRDAAALKSSQTRMTEFIHKVADPQALLQVLLQGDQQLNAIHLTAAAVALLRCAEQQERLLSDNQYRHKVRLPLSLAEAAKLAFACTTSSKGTQKQPFETSPGSSRQGLIVLCITWRHGLMVLFKLLCDSCSASPDCSALCFSNWLMPSEAGSAENTGWA